jgi:putative NIF3 family GTP cyclohydrolase 1 type 2
MRRVTVSAVERAVARRFPPEWAEEWDRVGLLAGDPEATVTGVALALDPTPSAIAETVRLGANVLLTHHPAFLQVPRWISPGGGSAGVLFSALSSNVALVNAHTNLDRAPGAGVLLPERLGLAPVRPVERSMLPVALVTVFVPPGDADRVAEAMVGAGAGRIGEYERCRFVSGEGRGTFVPNDSATPRTGKRNSLSSSSEVRLEMIAPRDRARGVAGAARGAHPYEEPFIVVEDVEIARAAARMGMLCTAPASLTLRSLAVLCRQAFDITPRIWGDPDRVIEAVVTATGSAGSLIGDVLAAGADALVAGEVRYHDALDASESGLAIVELGHDVSEWPLVALLDEVVRSIEHLDPNLVHRLCAMPGWWTP